MAQKGDRDAKSARETEAGSDKQHEKDADNSRTAGKQNAGGGGHK